MEAESFIHQAPPPPPHAINDRRNGEEEEVVAVAAPHRPLVNYHPSVWGDYFITHHPPPLPQKKSEAEVRKRVEEMVVEVKMLLLSNAGDLLHEMQLIDALEHLGISYHFEEEIHAILRRIKDEADGVGDRDDLHAVSLWFRLLRQNGYNVPSDVFNKFKDDDGKFKAALGGDAKGLLGLYEAAYLGKPGEDILDEAIDFARSHLESMMADHGLEPPLADRVTRALETPLVRRMKRLEARQYISVYQDDEELRNDTVLELAKLDYHLLQQLYWEEVRSICMWMKELGLMEKLPFARDRVVELYFWIVGVFFEPCYSRSRMMTTKVTIMVSIMDDFYDSYGTLEELQAYTDAVQRWELEAVDEVPEYMRDHFLALIDTLKGFEDELEAEDNSYRVYYLKEALKIIVRAYLQEAKWREEKCVPSVEEHLSISMITGGYAVLACASYVGMGRGATKEAFDWVTSFPKIVEASSVIVRVMDDIVSHEFEQAREHVASTVECYVKEHGVSVQEAYQKLQEMIEDAWKVMNLECLDMNALPMPLMMPIVNLARMMEAVHKHIDGYTHSSAFLKGMIDLVLVQPVPI